MTVNPYDKAHELARAIRTSDAYQRYVAASQRLHAEPEAEQRITSFRQLQMELHQAQLAELEVSETQATHLSLSFMKLREDPVTAEFIDAEEMFFRIYSDIQSIIQKAVESELNFDTE